MARPTTKSELIAAANSQFGKLFALIDAMPQQEQVAEFRFDTAKAGKEAHWGRDRNIRDILIHLYEWHQLLRDWAQSNRGGVDRPFLPEPYNWKTYGDMNVGFWEKHQSTPYERSREMLKESHGATVDLIATFTDNELFTKGAFKWTGTTTLGSYCVSATSSHYDWAIRKIRKIRKIRANRTPSACL